MDSLLLYLLKVSALISLFYLCYLLLFRKDTFFVRNRILLILTLVLPTTIPVLKIPVLRESPVGLGTSGLLDNPIFSETTSLSAISINESFDYNLVFKWIYFIIAGLLLLKVAISIITTLNITRKGTVFKSQFPKVIISDLQHPPFSFFPYVVIPKEDFNCGKYLDVLEHESAHIKQGHTFDLLLCEICIAFQWFNPFIWLIRKSIILNHEYLADHASLINNNVKEYQIKLLNFQVGLKNISLAHNFNSLIKNRIIMINKKSSSKFAILKNFLILPVVAFAAYAFVTPEYHYDKTSPSAVVSMAEGIVMGSVTNEQNKPMWGVRITVSDISTREFTDQNGSFTFGSVPNGSSIVFSYKGYKTITLNPDFSKNMIVKMMKDPDVAPPDIKLVPPKTTPSGQTTQPPPLYIVDGVERENSHDFLDPNTFNTAYFLKGDSATAIFGEKAKNGVIVVTLTKDGKRKQEVPRISR
jgi:hypothetical protein